MGFVCPSHHKNDWRLTPLDKNCAMTIRSFNCANTEAPFYKLKAGIPQLRLIEGAPKLKSVFQVKGRLRNFAAQ
jgi:hypothetical protein